MNKRTCSIEGCSSPVRARGWCDKHWQRWWNHGDPLFIKTGRGLPEIERFWRQVVKTPTCWLWTGSGTKHYGIFNAGKKSYLAHRYAYINTVGPIPKELELDHRCRVKKCVNPEHLEAVTHAVNMQRAWDARFSTLLFTKDTYQAREPGTVWLVDICFPTHGSGGNNDPYPTQYA